MLALIALTCLQVSVLTSRATADRGSNSFYVGNRAPLKPSPFYKLPIRVIKPRGWLLVQLKNEANGETGHLEEISPWLEKRNNAWISATGVGEHGWEELPYWLKGFGDLGYVLSDSRIVAHAKVWIEGALSSQRADGYFGPRANLLANKGTPDMWPNMVMLFALQSYYEWSRDQRVLPFMTRYFKWQANLPEDQFYLSYWEKHRGGDNLESVYWLYNRTGEPFLLDLARKIHRRTADWMTGVPDWHGVNFAQAFREPEEYAELETSAPGVEATEADYSLMRKLYGQVPGGMYGADENARPGFHDPRQGTETCAMVEMMLSDEMLLLADGNPKWADRCEDVAFNSLPAALTPDEEALHYLTAPNLVDIDAKSKAPGFQNGGPMLLMNPYDHRCCQHNVSHGWPYLAEHLWVATAADGLAAIIYAPSTVEAKVGEGNVVQIEEKTEYPFRDSVRFVIHAKKPVKFPFSFRVPGWARGGTVTVGNQIQKLPPGPCVATLERSWREGETVELKLPMKISIRKWDQNGGAISVDRGPLTFGLKIGEKVVKSGGTAEFPATEKYPAWEIHPTSSWNYGLVPDLSLFTVKELPYNPDRQPFATDNLPLEIQAPARQIPQWQQDYTGLVAILQKSPAQTASPETRVALAPMAALRLRISEFPTVTSKAGEQWRAPDRLSAPIPARSSHVFAGDSAEALSDGLVPVGSGDQTVPRFTWWDHKGSEEWVEYDFPSEKTLTSSEVYWFDDTASGGGCRVPRSWKLQAWFKGRWQDLASNYSVDKDRFNRAGFAAVTTSKLRLTAQLQEGYSGGILQWRVN